MALLYVHKLKVSGVKSSANPVSPPAHQHCSDFCCMQEDIRDAGVSQGVPEALLCVHGTDIVAVRHSADIK